MPLDDSDPEDRRGYMACMFYSIIFIVAILALTFYGSIEVVHQSSLKETTCLVLYSTYNKDVCHSSGRIFTCYEPRWDIQYRVKGSVSDTEGVINGKKIDYKEIDAGENPLAKHKIGSSDPCFYSTRHVNIVQWEPPTLKTGLGCLIAGAGLFLLTLVILGIAVGRRCHAKNTRTENNQSSGDVYHRTAVVFNPRYDVRRARGERSAVVLSEFA
ncbi:hypothetical protein I4U23_017219 [Adineta vaga]|nr:hypothetical protein I4U23_017219 [Adineta vaga]